MKFILSLLTAAALYVSIFTWAMARTPSGLNEVEVAQTAFIPLPLLLPDPAPAELPFEPPSEVSSEPVSEPLSETRQYAMRIRPTEAPKPAAMDVSAAPAPAALPEPSTPATSQPDESPDEDATDVATSSESVEAAVDASTAPKSQLTDESSTQRAEDPAPEANDDTSDDTASDADATPELAVEDADLPEDLQQLPDLIIETGEDTDWDKIDAMLGIQTLAYTVDTTEPTTYFSWTAGGQAVESEEVDLQPFSNRCRDRNTIDHFRRRLTRAKRDLGISRPMRVVGLVPNDVDRKFAATQLAAIRASGLEPGEVRCTVARYAIREDGNVGIVIQKIKPFKHKLDDVRARATP